MDRPSNRPERRNSDPANQLDSLLKWRAKAERDLEKIDHFLFGNGSPGMDETLRRVVKFIDRQEEKEAAAWTDTKKFAVGILAFIINTLIALAIAKAWGAQ
jgi:hypothetical protein